MFGGLVERQRRIVSQGEKSEGGDRGERTENGVVLGVISGTVSSDERSKVVIRHDVLVLSKQESRQSNERCGKKW